MGVQFISGFVARLGGIRQRLSDLPSGKTPRIGKERKVFTYGIPNSTTDPDRNIFAGKIRDFTVLTELKERLKNAGALDTDLLQILEEGTQ